MKKFKFRFDARAYTMLLSLIIIWVTFTLLTDGSFLTPRNLSNLSRQVSITAILAIGMVMVIVGTHIDLSVGSLLGLTGGLAAILQVWYGVPTPLAMLGALALGALIGLWHGYWVAYQKVPAFIVTLAGLIGYRGILMGITKGQTIAPLDPSFKIISQEYVGLGTGVVLTAIAIGSLIFLRLKKRRTRKVYGFDVQPLPVEILLSVFYSFLIGLAVFVLYQYQGIPYLIILVAILVLGFNFLTNNTPFGRQVYAMGGNVEAARLSGVNIKRRTLVVFMLAGLMAAVAGIVSTARLNAATITAGTTAELDAIAACVIGGTSLLGGVGNIPGAILGALIMASVDNGMSMMNLEAFWQYIIKGLILLFAVWIDMKTRRT